MLLPSTWFEELGFYYIGPIDGHNVNVLLSTLQNLKMQKGPRFLHIVTQKGKGIRSGRSQSASISRRVALQPGNGQARKESVRPDLYPCFRQVALRYGGCRSAAHRDHSGDARRIGAGSIRKAVSRPIFRCRHRRAAFGYICRRIGLRGHEACRRHLFDLSCSVPTIR